VATLTDTWRSLAYLAASLLFILSLRGLSTQESARRGNAFGIVGMAIAVVMTALGLLVSAFGPHAAETGGASGVGLLGAGLGIGCVVGALLAARVAMTSMPELVAVLHSFVGAAAVLVGIATYMHPGVEPVTGRSVHLVEIFVGVLVGAVTFSGSVIAFGKLRGVVSSKPLLLPGRHLLNLLMVLGCMALAVVFLRAAAPWPPDGGALFEGGMPPLMILTGIALVLGMHLVLAIGGGDMPVVVSMLNSYSGWAAAAAGFMLSNDLLIITGALVGSSGAILSYIMCKAMNRSIVSVILGGFGSTSGEAKKVSGDAKTAAGHVNEATVPQVAELLLAARSVIIVPGYGMAVAQAQHQVKEISSLLIGKGVKVRYAIHPVAGRLPGHMNVLLAEANVSYDIVKEMDEINEDFPTTDVVMVIGANDIVNPSAQDDSGSPIYGMPVLEVWKAARVVMLKRSMAAGYAGVDNPLAYNDNTLMLFGDARQSVTNLLTALRSS
jgi:NAD(P) transhydrogenase subunit beta